MSSPLRKLPEQKPRVETGPIRFGNDWPGLFIRGDNAISLAYNLAILGEAIETSGIKLEGQAAITMLMLPGLIRLLESCNTRHLSEYNHGQIKR